MWDNWTCRKFNLYQINNGIRERIEFLKSPSEISSDMISRPKRLGDGRKWYFEHLQGF